MAQAEYVPAEMPSPEEVAGTFSNILTRGGASLTEANISSQTREFSNLLQMLQSGGAAALDPQLLAELNSVMSSVAKATKAPLKKISQSNAKITNWQADVDRLQARIDAGETLTKKELNQLEGARKKIAKESPKLEALESRVGAQNQRLQSEQERLFTDAPRATDVLREAFPELGQTLQEATPYLDRMGQLGATGERLMSNLSAGYTPGAITTNDIAVQRINSPRMSDFGRASAIRAAGVGNISAAQVGSGALGQSLMDEARRRVSLQGQLSPEATRDAIQSARQAFSARGLVTGNAALGAELLNRDRYSRQRGFEDLGFAQGVQAQDLGRQFQNVGNQLQASQANQQTQLSLSQGNQNAAMQAEMANLDARLRAAIQQGNWQLAADTQNQMATLEADNANANRALQASVANEESMRLGTQLNNSMLTQAFTTDRLVNQEGLNAALTRGELTAASNPNSMMLSMYGGGTRAGSETVGAAGNITSNYISTLGQINARNADAQMWTNAANSLNPGNMQASTVTGSAIGDFALNTGVNIGTRVGERLLFGGQ